MAPRSLLAGCCVVLVVLGACVARGGEFLVPLMAKAPALDGKVEPGEWARAASFAGFAFRGTLERRRVSARVGATASHIFVALRSQLPAEGELTAKVQKDTVKLVFDDSVEVWIDPTPGTEHGHTFQMLANPAGRVGYKHHARGRERERPAWRGHWKVAHGMHDGQWHCEVAVPLAEIAPGRTADQGAWAINLCRNWKQPWAFSSLGGGPYAPEGIRFTFATDDALAIHHEIRGDPFVGDLKMALKMTNPTAKPIAVKAAMHLTRDAMPALRADDTLTLAPGETKRLSFDTGDEATRKFKLAIVVHSAAGKRIHYSRSYAWKAAKPWRWATRKKKALPIDLRFAYYPYRNRMRVSIDTSNLPEGAEIDRLVCVLRKKGEGKPIKTVVVADGIVRIPDESILALNVDRAKAAELGLAVADIARAVHRARRRHGWGGGVGAAELSSVEFAWLSVLLVPTPDGGAVRLDQVARPRLRRGTAEVPVEGRRFAFALSLPPLDGAYEIAVRAEGRNVPEGEFVKEFERTVYEWERKGLGTGRKVYAPFTAIRVKGTRVWTVLREHTMNGFGLWKQVVARGNALLADGMRFVVVQGGAPARISSSLALSEIHFQKIEEDKVVALAPLRAGFLGMSVRSTWDYDGVMRVDLALSPGQRKPIEALRLEIPLKDDVAPMIHAMGDGIRNTVYARVPQGQGVVWDSSKVQVNDFARNFCSYVYVGSPVRGLCWFAENDKGWSWDREKPNLDLVRKGDQLILRVHFINKPTVIDQARTITFGLLAAPVKPRIANWRYIWRRENYTLLGTDINWLARGNCGSVYPAAKDLYLWEMLKRGNREKLPREEVQKVIDRGRKYFEPYGPDYVERYVRHVPHNLISRHGKKMVFYYNRASCQLFPEFQTFQDEWCLTDYRTVGPGNGIGEIKIVPSGSYIDHALWWYGKSFDVGGNQGVYWDNYYFRGSYNTAMTAAYRKGDGSTVPSNGIWGLRELARRTFVYMNERGMRPITMVHMTSTGILPVYSFCTVQYDWEWKYSQGDVQYRFPREYILLVTTGELAGTWPVLLGDHGKLARDEWTQRTFAGVCLVHELDGWGGGKAWTTLFQHVHRLVETEGLDVFRYWDDRPQPAVATRRDLPTIVYSLKGKEALVAVVSYAEKDVAATLTIAPGPLGLDDGYRVVDAETDEPISAKDHKLSFPLKKHDVRAFRLLAR